MTSSQERTLTPEEVELIRQEIVSSGERYARVAERWKLDIGHVRFIGNRFEESENDPK